MLAVGGIGTSTVTARFARRNTTAASHDAEAPSSARALVLVAAPTPAEQLPIMTRRPLATFLTQLIATRTQMPQTRVRRRAGPQEAAAAYGGRPIHGACGRGLALDA